MPKETPLPPPGPDEPWIAVSIKQPWAWLIIRPDIVGVEARAAARVEGLIKDIENRSWPTRHRGGIYVHAGKQPDNEAIAQIEAKFGIKIPENLPLGGIVGRMWIDDCVTHSKSPWFEGEFGWVIGDSKPLPFRPMQGALGFFGCKP